MRRHLVLIGLVGLLALSLGAAQRPITVESLLGEMTDLAGMAEFPEPAYTTRQFSSYDRKSLSPTKDWFANGDAGQYLRVEDKQGRKEHVMMDAAGPGAIVRIWSANPKGTLRIYIDGGETPALEAKMTDLLGGTFPGLPKPIAGERSKGWNLYFPIPYAKHCKVTSDEGGFYYHVNYRTYAAGTPVTSFTMDQLRQLSERVTGAAQALASPRGPKPGKPEMAFSPELSPGAAVKYSTPGPNALTCIIIRLPEQGREAALRSLVMKISFDGNQTVEAPVGDFFGSGPGLNAYESLPSGMTKDGEMYSHWVMPFKESATFEFKNLGTAPVSFTGQVLSKPYTWTDRSMYFHAKWRADFDVSSRPMIDWNYLTATGRGVFAGVTFNIDNPVRDWWGEGDEKIYVDGETFPSHFGTGTEDYFGYAWCWPGLFVHAYHNQTRCDGPGNYGRTSVSRWHILDRIPFTKDFKFDMELWHWKECKVNMSVISYWYAMPGGSDTFKPITASDVVIRPVPEMPKPPRVAGAIEGEEMKVVSATGQAETQEWPGVSNGHQLWWKPGTQPGGEMLVTFKAPKAGKYRIFGRFLKAKDYGIVQLAFNGQKAGEPIDFYNPTVVPQKEMDLGVFELKAGDNQLKATITGSNPQAIKSHMFGMDYFRLVEEK